MNEIKAFWKQRGILGVLEMKWHNQGVFEKITVYVDFRWRKEFLNEVLSNELNSQGLPVWYPGPRVYGTHESYLKVNRACVSVQGLAEPKNPTYRWTEPVYLSKGRRNPWIRSKGEQNLCICPWVCGAQEIRKDVIFPNNRDMKIG